MKKTAIALTPASLLALPLLSPPGCLLPWCAPLQRSRITSSSSANAGGVDQLLADAARIFHSPPGSPMRVSPPDAEQHGSRSPTPLLEAHQLEPYRTDLLVSAANAQIHNGNVERAIALLQQAQSGAGRSGHQHLSGHLAALRWANPGQTDGYVKRVGEPTPVAPPICSGCSPPPTG